MLNMTEIRKLVIQKLKNIGIPYNSYLPEQEELFLRPVKEVAERIICLYALIGLSMEGINRIALKDWLLKEKLLKSLNPIESSLFDTPRKKYTLKQKIELSWLRESMSTLMWSGGLIEELPLPEKPINIDKYLLLIPPEAPVGDFINNFSYRDIKEIIYQVDLYYCIHSAITDNEINRIDKDVVIERRLALEWISSYNSWYEVSLDT